MKAERTSAASFPAAARYSLASGAPIVATRKKAATALDSVSLSVTSASARFFLSHSLSLSSL